ncbi:MAG: hypothetical protein JRJ66_12610 [Deltaproteobacteria bacterium]|nr:hypothetical protein [Deltaproteobacteria bacterium]MBW2046041.1 hypothetical protein [Deltaproteobacteria bacterium]
MREKPVWLPAMVQTNGEWQHVLRRLYQIFENDFKNNRCLFRGSEIWWDKRILEGDDFEEGFWHLITKGGEQRLFDPRRAERLPWCSAIINNANDGSVKVWDYKEKRGAIRTYLWLEDWDYAIILEKKQVGQRIVFFVITAFHVDGESRRRSLRVKYSKRIS